MLFHLLTIRLDSKPDYRMVVLLDVGSRHLILKSRWLIDPKNLRYREDAIWVKADRFLREYWWSVEWYTTNIVSVMAKDIFDSNEEAYDELRKYRKDPAMRFVMKLLMGSEG